MQIKIADLLNAVCEASDPSPMLGFPIPWDHIPASTTDVALLHFAASSLGFDHAH